MVNDVLEVKGDAEYDILDTKCGSKEKSLQNRPKANVDNVEEKKEKEDSRKEVEFEDRVVEQGEDEVEDTRRVEEDNWEESLRAMWKLPEDGEQFQTKYDNRHENKEKEKEYQHCYSEFKIEGFIRFYHYTVESAGDPDRAPIFPNSQYENRKKKKGMQM